MADKYISAEALTLSLRDDPDLNAASFARVKRHIEAAPDMVKRGEWINDAVEGFSPFVDSLPIWIDVMQCSVCKEYIDGSHPKNFCPHCGADMRGVEDG